MNHPLVILRTLDSFLTRETRIVLYGRAALALGFAGAPSEFGVTRDVDAILPATEMAATGADEQFWRALDQTNRVLPQDLEDIEFLLRQERFTENRLKAAFAQARCPEIREIRESFGSMQPQVLAIARRLLEGACR